MRRPAGRLAAVACAAALVAGCQTTGGSGAGGGSTLDGAIGRCVAAVVGGAIVGGLIGAAAGGGNRVGYGVAGGAAVGGLACAVLTALDNQDKAAIRQAQIEAASTNEPRTLSYAGADGRPRAIMVRPSGAETVVQNRVCRPTDGVAAVGGVGETQIPAQLVCRTPEGDWLPA
ncbi:hypothetical protein GCM10008171_13090 [Methylopila jiangsuensis]|uniref:17 kDa surface antigen n=1 Tax=Methylopila jiangsuensis TaxID=586230 RepID=A0A9W6JHR5_9HYPH|nr:hypothetical protein [Methylopila jiangsuensis]MDR6286292.1 hypothetical protein [Methylopila jiangsuensis]GLK76055.1 hypothetical protein GCM10008171_13090 [Methylopila jiangsuensis]